MVPQVWRDRLEGVSNAKHAFEHKWRLALGDLAAREARLSASERAHGLPLSEQLSRALAHVLRAWQLPGVPCSRDGEVLHSRDDDVLGSPTRHRCPEGGAARASDGGLAAAGGRGVISSRALSDAGRQAR